MVVTAAAYAWLSEGDPYERVPSPGCRSGRGRARWPARRGDRSQLEILRLAAARISKLEIARRLPVGAAMAAWLAVGLVGSYELL
jgi:hypothetical protein